MVSRERPIRKEEDSPMPEGTRIKMTETYGRLLAGTEYVVDPTTAQGLIDQKKAVKVASRPKRRKRK